MSKKIELNHRAAGLVTSVRGLGLNDHICLAYADPSDFRQRMLEFLADGVALGQRIQYAGSGSTEELRSDLDGLADLDALIKRGAARLVSIGEASGAWISLDAKGRVARYAASTNDALAAGFTGLRGVSERSSLILTEDDRVTCAQTEYLTDQFMTVNPLSLMCAYRLEKGSVESVTEMACLHPLVSNELAPFRLYARGGGIVALAGEIDYSCADLFDKALERALPLFENQKLAVDASELTFIDHRGLLALDRHAGAQGVTLVLRGLSSTAVHVAGLLGLSAIRVESI